ncbi:unnamed protein product [Polarella glacialis]|uniref:Ku domain-containing protein n=1 Tax=Polarella glacialis TaxID=89957 RepID=A0A813LXX5_POLGL|nr:unnamed protein product [Polarella glacialis]
MAGRSKDATVLVVDVGLSMRETIASSEEGGKITKADMAARLARNVLRQKLLFAPKHEVGLVLFGTSETSNDLQDDGYQNVVVARDRKIDAPDVDALRCLSQVPAGGVKSDAVNALIVALDLLIKRTKDLKYEKTIRLITDAMSVTPGDADILECFKQLEATDTQLCVTLVGTDQGAWADLAGVSPKVRLVPLSTLARESSLSVKPVEQRAKVRLSLEMSPDMQIPVAVFSRTTPVRFPTLKKQSKLAANIQQELRRTDKVILDRTYHATDDPHGEEVKKEDRIKGHKYGQSIVPMSEYDEAALLYTCDRALTALGFAAADTISAEHSMHQIETVAPDKGDRWAHCAFESIVDAMVEDKRVLIARYCFRKDAQPRMVALIPRKGRGGEASSLTLQYLPFAEDIREWTCASLPQPSENQRQAVSHLLDTMLLEVAGPEVELKKSAALSASPEAEDGLPPMELLKPEDTNNPALSRFYSFLAQRAVDAADKVQQSEHALASPILGPPAEVLARLAKAGYDNEKGRLKSVFGLERVETPVGGRGRVKRFWREAIAEKRKDAAGGEVDTKRIKVDPSAVKKAEKEEEDENKARVKDEAPDDGEANGMAAAVGLPPKVHIGSVHPERDFERLLSERAGGADIVGPAVEQMCDIICSFAEEGDEFHGKALSCLAALRRGCVREGEAAGYNELLRKLRLGVTKRQAKLWEKASKDGALGLITDAEVVTSTVSSAEARAFLAGEDIPGSAHASSYPLATEGAAGAGLSEKDLEDMIE